jgi:hypothetical protein
MAALPALAVLVVLSSRQRLALNVFQALFFKGAHRSCIRQR